MTLKEVTGIVGLATLTLGLALGTAIDMMDVFGKVKKNKLMEKICCYLAILGFFMVLISIYETNTPTTCERVP